MVSKLEMERLDRASISDRRELLHHLVDAAAGASVHNAGVFAEPAGEVRLQCVGGTAAGGQQVGQLFAGIGEGRSGIGAVLARRPGQCAADAPHPHLFFGVAQPGDSSLGLSAASSALARAV